MGEKVWGKSLREARHLRSLTVGAVRRCGVLMRRAYLSCAGLSWWFVAALHRGAVFGEVNGRESGTTDQAPARMFVFLMSDVFRVVKNLIF